MTEKYESLPQGIKDILDSWDGWDDNEDLYSECNRIQKELEKFGWTCSYGPDGMVHDVRQSIDESYLETHYEVAQAIAFALMDGKCAHLRNIQEESGTGGLWLFAKELTNEFEQTHADNEWEDGDYFETLEAFLEQKFNVSSKTP
jgi:hypothetical protein